MGKLVKDEQIVKKNSMKIHLSSTMSLDDTYIELILIDSKGVKHSVGVWDPFEGKTKDIVKTGKYTFDVNIRDNALNTGVVNYQVHTRTKDADMAGGFSDNYTRIEESGITIIE